MSKKPPFKIRVFTDPDDVCDHQYEVEQGTPIPDVGDVVSLDDWKWQEIKVYSGRVVSRHFTYFGGYVYFVDLHTQPIFSYGD